MIPMFYKVIYSPVDPSVGNYFLISPILNLSVRVAEGPVMTFIDPKKWSDGITITSVLKDVSVDEKEMALKLYEDQVASINSDMGFLIKIMGLKGLTRTYFPWYLIIDGDNVTLQGYDYFWDPDDRFQSVFRDRMGGNHQWLFNWYNLGGRSELADIVEVSCSPAGQPLMKFFWETNNGGKYVELLQFVKSSCKTRDVPEFNKRSNYIKDRGRKHVEEGDMEPNEALDYALRDLKSAAKRQDPDVFYQEYAEMGFDHPRPDYKDKKWKL